jgi:ribonuclease HII
LKSIIVGVDEAGRGPLAGAVVAGAVILDAKQPIAGLKDSKKLSSKQREALAVEIKAKAQAWSVAQASVEEIDRLNILKATLLAMHRSVDALIAKMNIEPRQVHVLVDGNRLPLWPYQATAIVKGDATEAAISAASILAKTQRDADLLELHQAFPMYGFDAHMGYPTAFHLAKLIEFGPCHAHRKSFGPVKALLTDSQKTLF